MYTRRNFPGILSLLHFDFPHYNADNSALKDEASQETWSRHGNIMTASKYSPADYTDSNTPKFGYRCLYSQSSTDYVTASNSHGTFDINSSGPYTFEVFIQPKTRQQVT